MKKTEFIEQLKGMLTEVSLALVIIALGGLISIFIIKVIGR
jgi:hypothetical protein